MSYLQNKFEQFKADAPFMNPVLVDGKVSKAAGLIIEATSKSGTVGDVCDIFLQPGQSVRSEIVGFKNNKILLMPLGETVGVAPGSRVRLNPEPLKVPVSNALLGRVLNGLGAPIDGKAPVFSKNMRSVYNAPPNPLIRQRITERLETGIRAIDGLVTLGKGQRVGIFAGSGVGKSVLLGMMARYTDADVNVIVMVGERGREVRDFIERDLGEEGLKKSVVIVATSDQAATVRIKSALIGTTIAEYFRDQGKNVLLLMDSLTRVSMAQREIGLAIGEPPASKGYTPSVFALMPRLLERAGNSDKGSITGLYTVLVDGDDMDEPIADAARSILDGHIVLSRKIATKGHYPAIDVLESVSRVKNEVMTDNQKNISLKLLEQMATYRESEDLINIGAYSKGTSTKIDNAIDNTENINTFLRQDIEDKSNFLQTMGKLEEIGKGAL
ncbi:MAG: flagellar protein export ATPase FliI [Calditrichaeota bacterium]|nr:MAG: flagellar protein export ATPase FliI [Calditrichota bacterium]MBL1204005.1 flagellar protein export ATPase FliI [Calditrichota bacterium]NOG43836.1 flagellar protein export ATPase FliI [Calditrichota bacterium]